MPFLVPDERIELPTNGLQNRCSTAELIRLARSYSIDSSDWGIGSSCVQAFRPIAVVQRFCAIQGTGVKSVRANTRKGGVMRPLLLMLGIIAGRHVVRDACPGAKLSVVRGLEFGRSLLQLRFRYRSTMPGDRERHRRVLREKYAVRAGGARTGQHPRSNAQGAEFLFALTSACTPAVVAGRYPLRVQAT